ncbi:MAG: RNA polymerase sigma factor [Lachnospiraceae bacterium]|nr:RNA polymerase sigma factor [Lachnospiraceae bacterium]
MSKAALRADADFEAFYERHWKYVYRLCYTYMQSEADAEDCTEDVFVKVLTGEFAFEDETHERKWLTITAINLCKDRLKSYGRRNVDSLDADDAPEVASPEQEDYSDVREAVMALPPKLKDVIWLYYFDGYSTDEIAEMLNRPPSTVRNQMKDARNLLRDRLKTDFGSI